MIYLTGTKNPTVRPDLEAGTMGLLTTPRSRYLVDGVKVWAMDNGCFTGTYPGDDAYLAKLVAHEPHRDRCLFVAVADVVGDSATTLAQFPEMAGKIRTAGWPVALVGQDGMEDRDVPWDLVDWLFVGGSTEWKLGGGARALIAQAHARGKRVHVGRVNSKRRYDLFADLGCHSADGTYIAFGPEINAPKVRKWMEGRR